MSNSGEIPLPEAPSKPPPSVGVEVCGESAAFPVPPTTKLPSEKVMFSGPLSRPEGPAEPPGPPAKPKESDGKGNTAQSRNKMMAPASSARSGR